MLSIIEGSVSHRLAVQEKGREASYVWGLEMLQPGEVHRESDITRRCWGLGLGGPGDGFSALGDFAISIWAM